MATFGLKNQHIASYYQANSQKLTKTHENSQKTHENSRKTQKNEQNSAIFIHFSSLHQKSVMINDAPTRPKP